MPRPTSRPPRSLILGATLAYFRARRALVPFAASVGYVVAIGVRVDGGLRGRALVLGFLALVLAFVAAGPRLPGNGLEEDGRRRVGPFAYSLWGLALVVASLNSNTADLWQDACGAVSALLVSVTGARAISRVSLKEGYGISASLTQPKPGVLVVTLLMLATAYGLALVASVEALLHPSVTGYDPLPHDMHTLASAGALAILAAAGWETLRLRRLVLGAGDRAVTSIGVVVAAGLVGAGLSVLGVEAPDRALRGSVAGAGAVVTFVATEGDAERVSRLGRRLVALLLFGGPVVLLGGLASQGAGRSSGAVIVTGLVCLGIGSALRWLELPLRRAEGHLLDAVLEGERALVRADPDTSVRDALAALRTFSGLSTCSPELWSLTPPRVLTIDGAGYAHERVAEAPLLLLSIAKDEPEATVRSEVLEALIVRRPDLRPLARWMDERGALSATLVTREGEAQGVLVLPKGARTAPMSLEEARALKRLADAFAGASAAHAALERSLERERLASERADRVETRLKERQQVERWVVARDDLATRLLAEPALAGPYSPAARVAFEALERRCQQDRPVVLVAPLGADIVPYLARGHLAGPRRARPFVVVDGTSSHPHARWLDPSTSPLALAARGALVLHDASRLPEGVQQILADALSQRHPPWSATDVFDVLVHVTARSSPAADLLPSLAALLQEPTDELVSWPHLRERGEDLRSLVLAGLGREGMRLNGVPLGIDDAAFAALADYPYPGEDDALRSIVHRLALLAATSGSRRLGAAEVAQVLRL